MTKGMFFCTNGKTTIRKGGFKAMKHKIWKKMLLGTLFTILGLSGLFFGAFFILVTTDTMTSVDSEKLEHYSLTTYVYDRNNEVVGSLHGAEDRTYVSIDSIPLQVRQAFIAAEDIRFYQHHGIDPIRMVGAAAANLRSRSLSQGASTITQQLVKNTHLSSKKSFSRKFEEIILALKVEREYTKNQILEMYLNNVYFGNGAYGIETAANKYFGKSASDLSLVESAALAATLKAPSNYAPHIQPENNQKRRNQILATMEEQGYISIHNAYEAQHEKLTLAVQETESAQGSWYLDAVLQEATKLLNLETEELAQLGLHIYTGQDTALQNRCDELFADKALFPEDAPDGVKCQGALVIMDSATGEILAMEGGREYTVRMGFNRVLNARRQPGSVLKPLAVYAPALERHLSTPARIFDDRPTDFGQYSPKNYGGKYYGLVTMRSAVAQSLNIPSVQMLSEMGGFTGYESLLRFQLEPDPSDTGLSLAVGSMNEGVRPIQLCAAYASLSSGGIYHPPVLIRRIEDRDGHSLYEAPASEKKVLDSSVSYVLTSLLQSVAARGTGKALAELGIPIAAKTGTVGYDETHHRDAWSAAYTPQIAAVCWVGFDQTDSLHALSSSVTGGKHPTQLLLKLFQSLNLSDDAFSQPDEGVVWKALDANSLQSQNGPLLAGPYTPPEDVIYEVFLSGTEPIQQAENVMIPQAPGDLHVTTDDHGMPLISFTVQDNNVLYHIYRKHWGFAIELDAVMGTIGEKIYFTDLSAQKLMSYEYYILPEQAATGVYGTPSKSFFFTVPLFSSLFPRE